jgi:hypothetical protein
MGDIGILAPASKVENKHHALAQGKLNFFIQHQGWGAIIDELKNRTLIHVVFVGKKLNMSSIVFPITHTHNSDCI